MSVNISTAFYDVMFGKSVVNEGLNGIEDNTLINVRDILNSPDKLCSHIPPLPIVLVELIETLKCPKSNFLDIVAIIEKDPSIAIQVLKIANTAKYNRKDEIISSLRKAVGVLGVAGVSSIASTVMVKNIMPQKPIYHKMFGKQIWLHSLYCASMCQILAPAHNENAFDAHLLGLIHDVGKIVIFECLCKAFETADIDCSPGGSVFKKLMSEMSIDISYFVAVEWKLPPTYVEALRQQRGKKTTALAKILFNANILSEVYLLYEKGIACEEQVADLLKKLALDDILWQEFLEQASNILAA
ncbi:MAG: HDOD domain-containing protein [Colwellia sp.]|nr:HDOD domain-containing protein [Colwellia sp.]